MSGLAKMCAASQIGRLYGPNQPVHAMMRCAGTDGDCCPEAATGLFLSCCDTEARLEIEEAATTVLCADGAGAELPPAAQWGQCGGLHWDGTTVCEAGFACFAQNPYFSQCDVSCPGEAWLCATTDASRLQAGGLRSQAF